MCEVRLMKKIRSLFQPAPVRASYADAGDFLRVACVGLIGWYHIWQQSWLNPNLSIGRFNLRFYPLVAGGYMFVDLMLALSGFLLMLGWLSGRSRDLRSFYTARAARILPSYWLCMAILLFGFALPGNLYYGSSKHMWTDILAHLSFTHNFFPESYSFTHLNGALWTLAVEVQFYLLFPLLAQLFERRPGATYIGMVLIAILSRTLMVMRLEDTTIYVNRLSAMLDVYANGMLAAWAYVRLQDAPSTTARAWINTALTILSAVLIYKILSAQLTRRGAEIVRQGQMLWRFPLSALGCAFLLCGSRSIRLLRGLFSNRITRFLSGISFNFYIWHQFLAVKLKEWRIPPSVSDAPNRDCEQPWQSRYTLLCFAAALGAAILVTYAVEKPCARWIKRRLGSEKTLESKRSA